jgi:hypothetical protein
LQGQKGPEFGFNIRKDRQMKFLSIYRSAQPEGTPPTQQEMEQMGALIEEWTKSGVLLAAEGCLPSATGARIRRGDAEYTVTDGPFTESKEIVGGFALIRAKSKQEAVEFIKRFMELAGDGECELRQVYGD